MSLSDKRISRGEVINAKGEIRERYSYDDTDVKEFIAQREAIIKFWLQQNFQSRLDGGVSYLGDNYGDDLKELFRRLDKLAGKVLISDEVRT